MAKESPPALGTSVQLGRLTPGAGRVVAAIEKAVGPENIERLRIGESHEGEAELRLVGGRPGAPAVLIWDLVTVGLDKSNVIGTVETRTVASELLPLPAMPGRGDGTAGVALGLRDSIVMVVTPELSTSHLGAGHAVLGTPDMIRLMERCAARTVRPHLLSGWSTVGVHVDVTHLAPAYVGDRMTVASRLVAIRGRRLEWEVTARTEQCLVGAGRHQHHIVRQHG